MRHLIIFDVDGTLIASQGADTKIFTAIVEQALCTTVIDNNWSNYRYSTDSGIIDELFVKHLRRKPSPDELQKIRADYVAALQTAFSGDKTLCQPIDGARDIFRQIQQLGQWDIALATGAWREPAHAKLDAANILYSALPKAYADDHVERTAIIQTAIKRAQQCYRCEDYQRVIYVGDQLWDQQAAQTLSLEFVGVGDVTFHDSAARVIADYRQATLLEFLMA
jgi:phosphoglycolate phosphatase-like HAD superfamily hydrolase